MQGGLWDKVSENFVRWILNPCIYLEMCQESNSKLLNS